MTCRYTPSILAEFGRKISAEEANKEFVAIETAMACLESLAEQITTKDQEIHNYGSIDNNTILDPAYGNMQMLTVEGNKSLDFIDPQDADPRVIYLLIADGGDADGTFTFPAGSAWSTDSYGASVTGAPWAESSDLGGDYGAMVTCIYDGLGWLYLVFGRNGIDFGEAANVTDIYNWR